MMNILVPVYNEAARLPIFLDYYRGHNVTVLLDSRTDDSSRGMCKELEIHFNGGFCNETRRTISMEWYRRQTAPCLFVDVDQFVYPIVDESEHKVELGVCVDYLGGRAYYPVVNPSRAVFIRDGLDIWPEWAFHKINGVAGVMGESLIIHTGFADKEARSRRDFRVSSVGKNHGSHWKSDCFSGDYDLRVKESVLFDFPWWDERAK